jgi:DNA helicase-4
MRAQQWAPPRAGEDNSCSLRRTEGGFDLYGPAGLTAHIPNARAGRIQITQRWWRTTVTVAADRKTGPVLIAGLTRTQGRSLSVAVEQALALAAAAWRREVDATIALAWRQRRWIPQGTVATLVAARPAGGDTDRRRGGRDDGEPERMSASRLQAWVTQVNDEIAELCRRVDRGFLDDIESSPLTGEQARAVVAYDNRVHVIAAAGSGKTSVMVGRAAYAVHRGFTTPERVLLLAFNRDAALELRDRVERRFTAAALPTGVHATTFHAFGLEVIGAATGSKPTPAPWVVNGQDAVVIAEIVAHLRAEDASFGHAWDVFRLLYARTSDSPDAPVEADAWDRDRGVSGLRTFAGDIVRSEGERLLADWLYLHHVPYEYERPYGHATSNAQHRQYHPDFYYPDIDVWHEHWGVDADGNPPPSWTGYQQSMAWKRALHRQHGTTLIETTWAGIMAGTDLTALADELRGRGVDLRWDPHRVAVGSGPVDDADVIRLVRTFMTHVKSNALTPHALEERARAGLTRNPGRAAMFLRLYWPIHHAWQSRLAAGTYVDFDDMLTQAAEHLESGRYVSAYDLVMVDELQDTSRSRARLTRALVQGPGKHLLAVGDDWQSINRFAGADLDVLTCFHDYFGPGPTVYLTTTFRCHQSISDTASAFVTKNPTQLRKTVTSVHTGAPDPAARAGVQLRTVAHTSELSTAVAETLDELEAIATAGRIDHHDDRLVAVDVLGRYRHDRQLLPAGCWPHLRLAFRTVHAAKGLEADYVIVPNLSTGRYGFPSQIADDPVLALAMGTVDTYPHAEERRLLYVAMTRARCGVILLAPSSSPSPFVAELLADGLVRHRSDIAAETPQPCPLCGRGVLTQRQGPYGRFWGCSTFPTCRHTSKAPQSPPPAAGWGSARAPNGGSSSGRAPRPGRKPLT